MKNRHEGITFSQYLKFYLPLAVTGVMLMTNHSTSSSAVARAAEPAIGLSAHASAFAVANIFETMCFGMQRMALTFVKGKKSFRTVLAVALKVTFAITGAMAFLAWTPLSLYVTQKILALTPEVAAKTIFYLKVFTAWPAASAIRSVYQSLVVVQERTVWTTVAMSLRLTASLIAATVLPKIWPNGPVGAVMVVGSLSVEMIVSIIASRRFIPPLEEEADDKALPTQREVLRFFLPLALAHFVSPMVKSLMIGSLARTVNAELTISGYQVATAVSSVLGAVTINMYQPVMLYVKDRTSFQKVGKYSRIIGVSAGILIFLCSLPHIRVLVFEVIMGAPREIADAAAGTVFVLAASPIIMSVNEVNLGILMLKKRTAFVTAAKIFNALVVGCAIVALTVMFPQGGSVLAALATVIGVGAEALLLAFTVRRMPECKEYFESVLETDIAS